jgi:hypothetical protein
MKTAITVRLNPSLLAAVRESAERENRSLTNFIETSLKEHLRISQAPSPTSADREFLSKGQ